MNETAVSSEQPVFFDPGQRRWPLVRRVAVGVVATVSILFALLLVTVVLQPALPALGLHGALGHRLGRAAAPRQAVGVHGRRTYGIAAASGAVVPVSLPIAHGGAADPL